MEDIYIAHINEETKEIQTVKEHSENTAKLCKSFAIDELKDLAYAIGKLHDTGKYQQSFQRRIRGDNIRVEHSICGAIEADKKFPLPLGKMAAYCIAGHHSGLPDGGVKGDRKTPDLPTLYARLSRPQEDYNAYEKELPVPDLDGEKFEKFLIKDCEGNADILVDKFAFLTRYCFSCLTDADTIDTVMFNEGEPERRLHADFEACLSKINRRIDSFVCRTDLQKTRRILQNQVFKKVGMQGEIFLMNMPTGSGKTLCSAKFALEKAVLEKKKRIIYIIPYNSIIDQTVMEFENIFGEDAEILRHQSSFSYEDEEEKEAYNEDYREAAKIVAENYDTPFIITTAVQFFESVYSHKKKKLRKLHNMADSILIFDEAHLMPREYLQPCLQAVAYITKYLNSEAVFLTATMPDFEALIREYALKSSRIVNLIDDVSDFDKFRKCRFKDKGEISAEKLALETAKHPSSLIVVNKKATAKEVYNLCSGKKYHLSTYMVAYDRQRVISEIRKELIKLEKDFPGLEGVPEERRIVIVSTSLIEAGVDIDVHRVYREQTGLDSILQAGGRCNREGKRSNATTCVFSLNNGEAKRKIDAKTNLMHGLLKKYDDISSPECIKEYYDKLFFINRDEIKMNTLSSMCQDIKCIPFRSYGEKFSIIDSPNISIAIKRDEKSGELIDRLKEKGTTDMRQLQKYTCSVSPKDMESLIQQNVVEDFGTGVWCLTNPDYYDENTGIKFEGEDYFL